VPVRLHRVKRLFVGTPLPTAQSRHERLSRPTALAVFAAFARHGAGPHPIGEAFDAEEVLARTYAAYKVLNSYADSGTVVDENKGFRDRFTFRTLQTREPRNFLLDFRYAGTDYDNGFKIQGTKRTVIWMQNGDLQTWDSESDAHQTYPADGGRQVSALNNASVGTRGISVLVPSLIYIKANMASVVQATDDAVAAGTEMVAGRTCLKVMGIERWRYPSGQVTGVRPVTFWIDAETYLIRKILEDTPKDSQRGVISRRIITLDPHADPPLETSRFGFAVPER
jgi:hypothetical protein